MYNRILKILFMMIVVLEAAFSGEKPEGVTPSWARVSPVQTAVAKRLGVPVAFENSTGLKFVLIPPGKFMMGSKDSSGEVARSCAMSNAQLGWFHDEHPIHRVILTRAFYMSVHEVSRKCYEALVKRKPKPSGKEGEKEKSKEPEDLEIPVSYVSWTDADKFCRVLSSKDKRVYFLPSEAQWEYACRAGTATPFSFGETITTDRVNYNGNYIYGKGTKGANRGEPVPVGSLPPNAWGLHEMHGNLSEWCADWYSKYEGVEETDPEGPEKGQGRVLRGGSWRSYPGACRSAFRQMHHVGARSPNIGFRVCCAIAKKPELEKAEKK